MLNRLRGNEFLRHNAVYFVAAVAVGALNYLYYPVLGRLMEPDRFGELQTLISLFLQAIAYLTVMGLVTIHIVANRSAGEANVTVSDLEKLALLISFGLLLLSVIFSSRLKAFFHFDSALPFVLLAAAVVISVPYMVRSAYVNGKKLFGLNALSSIAAAGGKLLLSAILVAAGFGVGGAVFGIVLAQLAALALAAHFARRHGFQTAGQATAAWPDSGYGGGNNNEVNTDVDVEVNGDNNIISVFINYVFG